MLLDAGAGYAGLGGELGVVGGGEREDDQIERPELGTEVIEQLLGGEGAWRGVGRCEAAADRLGLIDQALEGVAAGQ